MGSLVYTELLNKPKYRKFLHGMFPWIGHVGICHAFMIPLIGAAKNCRSGFVEFQCDPWTANPWVRPLIGKNMEGLTLKLEKFVDSILKYARPDLMIVDTDWCQPSAFYRILRHLSFQRLLLEREGLSKVLCQWIRPVTDHGQRRHD